MYSASILFGLPLGLPVATALCRQHRSHMYTCDPLLATIIILRTRTHPNIHICVCIIKGEPQQSMHMHIRVRVVPHLFRTVDPISPGAKFARIESPRSLASAHVVSNYFVQIASGTNQIALLTFEALWIGAYARMVHITHYDSVREFRSGTQ